MIVLNLKLLDECLGPSLALGRVSFCKAAGSRELLAPLGRVLSLRTCGVLNIPLYN